MAFSPPLELSEVADALGRAYSVEAVLQAGGQGAVFRARPRPPSESERLVALKVYSPAQVEERLVREFDALKSLKGATIVELVDAGNCVIRGEDCRYLVTTYIDGEPLDGVLARDGGQPVARVARIGHDIALALDQVWAARIVHRDVKPNNVMVTPQGGAVLIDLGVARHMDLTSLTTAGKTWGTAGYLSPEQALGRPLTCKSDVFALGILLQECILGRHPTGRRQEFLLQGGTKTAALRADLPRHLVHLVDEMVHRTALRRPTPAKVASALAQLAATAQVRS